MKFLTLTIMIAFVFGLSVAGQVLGAGEQESGKSKSESAAMEQQKSAADMEEEQAQPASGQKQASAQQLNSDQLRQVQQSLQEKGIDPGPIDGIMGPKTRAAIQQFQQQEGITATGQPNQQTLEALDVEFMGVSPAFGEKGEQKEQQQMDQQREQQQKEQPEQMKQQETQEKQQSK